MKLKRRFNTEPKFEMSSMTDLVFLLLIFFMLITTMIVPNVNALKLLLPNSSTAKKTEPATVSVAINENKEYFLEKQQIGSEDLYSAIETKLSGVENPAIILHTHHSVPIENVVSVMDVANKLKVKLVLATTPEK